MSRAITVQRDKARFLQRLIARRSGLAISVSDSYPGNPGSDLDMPHENFDA